MGVFLKSPRAPRRFSYEPRFYDPKREEDMKRRMRIKSLSHRKRRSPAGIIVFVILFVFAVYIYASLGGV